MTTIRLVTEIRAPIAVCFDLARSVDAHLASAGDTGERAIAGVTRGLLNLGDEVTWQAKHFGIQQKLRVRITQMDPPHRFTDAMVEGAFRTMEHVHELEWTGELTRMRDTFMYTTPFGILGRIVDVIALERHMREFLLRRNEVLKVLAESAA